MTRRNARMRSGFATLVPDFESAGFATQPACFDFLRAFRSAASIACVSALRMLRVRASPTFRERCGRPLFGALRFQPVDLAVAHLDGDLLLGRDFLWLR